VESRVEPLDDHVTLVPSSFEEETASGIVLPGTSNSVVRTGVVLAIGNGVTGIGPGDRVLYRHVHAVDVRLPPEAVVLVAREDVVARFAD
jgi:co-chaperonin GroES (HSP10)